MLSRRDAYASTGAAFRTRYTDPTRCRRFISEAQTFSNGELPWRIGSKASAGPELEAQIGIGERESSYRRADEHGDAAGAFNLGVLLEERGDLPGAEEAYRRASERGLGLANSNLGVLLHERGDLAGAEEAYRRASERGEARGAFNLGVLLEERYDLATAQLAYRRADELGHAGGASNLGVLLEGQGDLVGAEAAYRRADERADPKGALNLGMLLEERREVAAAHAAYRRAGEREQAPKVPRATLLDLRARIPQQASRPPAGPLRPSPHPEQASAPRQRAAPSGTKKLILAALADGTAKTGGEVAATTGLPRGTVSATLSRLAKSGAIVKADRGYRLPTPNETEGTGTAVSPYEPKAN